VNEVDNEGVTTSKRRWTNKERDFTMMKIPITSEKTQVSNGNTKTKLTI
jgi:hypothetical protein